MDRSRKLGEGGTQQSDKISLGGRTAPAESAAPAKTAAPAVPCASVGGENRGLRRREGEAVVVIAGVRVGAVVAGRVAG